MSVNDRIAREVFGWHTVELNPPVPYHIDGFTGYLTHELVDGQGESFSEGIAHKWAGESNCWEHAPVPAWNSSLRDSLRLAEITAVKIEVVYGVERGWLVRGRGIELEVSFSEIPAVVSGMIYLERWNKDNSQLKWVWDEE